MFDIKEFLAMSEEARIRWLRTNIFTYMPYREWIRTSLAELAFRLRGEVCRAGRGIDNYNKALYQVYNIWETKQNKNAQTIITYTAWLVAFIEPIYMIAAALAAKETK